jgi:Rod binding domain-containing protein
MGGINSPLSILPPSTGSLDGGYSNISTGKHENLATAAQQFEALMMQQMLQSSHDPDAGWFGTGDSDEDQANNQAMEIAQQQFASALAAHGGLGLAKMVVSHLKDDSSAHANETAAGNGSNTSNRKGTHGII